MFCKLSALVSRSREDCWWGGLTVRVGALAPLTAASSVAWPAVQVACVWLPHLPLRSAVLHQPAWDGRPLVLGSAPGQRKEVQLCSPEAARAGIHPGLPLREVVALCRDAIIVPPDPVRTATVLEEILVQLQRVSPAVELTDDHSLYLDLRGLQRLYHDDFAAVAQAIRAQIPAVLRPRLGAAWGKFTAAVAARQATPATVRVVPRRDTATFLAPLPIRYLPFSAEAVVRLHRLGLRRIGELGALPLGAVQAQFGPPGARAWRLVNGHDDEPLVPQPYAPAVRATLRLDDPLTSVDAIQAAVRHLLAHTFGAPAFRGRSAHQVRLRALLSDGASWERLFTFKEALSSHALAERALRSKLALPGGLPTAPVEELGLELRGLGREAAKQPSLFTTRVRQGDQIAEAARHLRARYGRMLLYHAQEVEPWSRIPERRWARVPYQS